MTLAYLAVAVGVEKECIPSTNDFKCWAGLQAIETLAYAAIFAIGMLAFMGVIPMGGVSSWLPPVMIAIGAAALLAVAITSVYVNKEPIKRCLC